MNGNARELIIKGAAIKNWKATHDMVHCSAFAITWKREHCDNMAIKALVYKNRIVKPKCKDDVIPNFHNNILDFLPAYNNCLHCANNRIGETPSRTELEKMQADCRLEWFLKGDCVIHKIRKQTNEAVVKMIRELDESENSEAV